MESKEFLLAELSSIEKWEKQQEDVWFWEKLGKIPYDESERLFIIKCLQFSASDIVGKQTILQELKDFDMQSEHENSMSQIKSWQEVFIVYRDNLGWKKLFQMIPIAGMLFGAHMNRRSIADIAEVGQMLYKKRRIIERLKALETNC